jgi:murein DD-endopeptidase MepM/ murein hydrolase activator NlpD
MPRLLLIAAVLAALASAAPAEAAGAFRWPVRGEVMTQFRTHASPYARGQHRGIDVAAPVGTPVRAAAAGLVRFAGRVGSSGLVVSIRTRDGRYDVSYLHLAALAVRAGQRVGTGALLGSVGTTGRRSARAPHLHLGVRLAGSRHAYVDPLTLLPPAAAARTGVPTGAATSIPRC